MKHFLLSILSLVTCFSTPCTSAYIPSADCNPNSYVEYSYRNIHSHHKSSVTDSLSSLTQRLLALLQHPFFEKTQVGIYVYDLSADSLIFKHNEKQLLRPASNQKLVTAITALQVLGNKYRFKTELYTVKSSTNDNESAILCIRGGYDPLFDNEDMQAFIESIQKAGITKRIQSIWIDLSLKDSNHMGWGWCWDDDTIPLKPLLYQNKDTFVQQLAKVLKKANIEWDGTVEYKSIPHSAKLLCTRTHSIDQVLLPVMKDSNNSAAEALFYQLAAADGHKYATRKHAAKHIYALIDQLGLNAHDYLIADGSGLSLYNYLSAELLGYLLRYAYSQPSIYKHLLPSLPIAGEDGTLNNRMKHTLAAGNVRAKTGSVEGVSSLSGYCTTSDGRTLCFSIINQGQRKNAHGRKFQDYVCIELCR